MADKDFIGGEPIGEPGRIAVEPFVRIKHVKQGDLVTFDYLNYRGELGERSVEFRCLAYGSNEYYPSPTWFLHGFDMDKKAERSFAFTNIKGDLKTIKRACGSCGQSVHSSTCAFKVQNDPVTGKPT